MKKKQIIFFSSFLFLIVILTFLSIYLRSNRLIKTEDISSIEKYITSYTNSIIPKHASIQIEFSDYFIESVNKNIDLKTVLKIYPSVKGEVYWLNDNTIEYNPYDNLKSNSIHSVKLSLNKLTLEDIEPKYFIF